MKRSCMVIALVAWAVGFAPPSEPQTAKKSGTVDVSREIRLTWDVGAPPPDLTAVLGRLMKPEVAGAIGKETLGIPPEVAAGCANAVVGTVTNDSFVVAFYVGLKDARKEHPEVRPAAREFADRLQAKFVELLAADRREEAAKKVQQAKQQWADVQYDFESTVRRLRDLQGAMAAKAGRLDASPETVRAARTKLEDERQRLELELAGIEARQKAVEQWIERTSKQLETRAKNDPVIAELEKAVAAMEKIVRLRREQYEAGVASGLQEVAEADGKLAEAKVQLLDRKNAAGGTPGGDALAALSRELQTLSIDVVDRKARLDYVQKRLQPLEQAGENITTYELMEADVSGLRRALEQAREQMRTAERLAQDTPRDRLLVLHSQEQTDERPPGSIRPE